MRLSASRSAVTGSRGLGDQLYDLGGARPTLDLDFANNGSLVDSVTGKTLVQHTRSSSATYVDGDGVIRNAVTNLVLQSEDFSTTWTRTGLLAFGSGSVVDALAAPNGTLTADLFTEDSSTGRHRVSQGFTFASGSSYTFSVYVKSTNRNVYLNFNTAFNASAGFDLSSGTYQINTGTASITNVGNGWYRISITATATSSATTSG